MTCKTQSDSQDKYPSRSVAATSPLLSAQVDCKTQSHSINKEEKKPPGILSHTSRANRAGFDGKAMTPKTVAHEPTQLSLLYSTLLSPFLFYTALPCSTSTSALLCSTLLYSSLVFSTLLCYTLPLSTLLFATSTSASTLPLLYLYSTSTLPLLYLYATLRAHANWTQ